MIISHRIQVISPQTLASSYLPGLFSFTSDQKNTNDGHAHIDKMTSLCILGSAHHDHHPKGREVQSQYSDHDSNPRERRQMRVIPQVRPAITQHCAPFRTAVAQAPAPKETWEAAESPSQRPSVDGDHRSQGIRQDVLDHDIMILNPKCSCRLNKLFLLQGDNTSARVILAN